MNTHIASSQTLGRVLQVTRDVFGQDVTVEKSFDPEFPADSYTVFRVQLQGPPSKVVALEEDWARRVNAIAPGDASFRLSLIAIP